MESLRAQTGNLKESRDPPARMVGLLDINVLPRRYRPSRVSFTTILAWLLLAVLVGLLYVSFQRFQAGTDELAAQRMRFQAAQDALEAAEVKPAELEQLQLEIEALTAETTELERLLAQLNIQQIQWGSELASIVGVSPPSVNLVAIEQSGAEVIVTGRSQNYQDALDFQRSLKESNQYARAALLSISRVENEAGLLSAPSVSEEVGGEQAESVPDPIADFLYEFRLVVELQSSGGEELTQEVSQ